MADQTKCPVAGCPNQVKRTCRGNIPTQEYCGRDFCEDHCTFHTQQTQRNYEDVQFTGYQCKNCQIRAAREYDEMAIKAIRRIRCNCCIYLPCLFICLCPSSYLKKNCLSQIKRFGREPCCDPCSDICCHEKHFPQ